MKEDLRYIHIYMDESNDLYIDNRKAESTGSNWFERGDILHLLKFDDKFYDSLWKENKKLKLEIERLEEKLKELWLDEFEK